MAQQVFTDMMGREVTIAYPPQRIISLVPSQTELLYDLGLDKEVIGITKFCVHPHEWFRNKTRIGGTKNVNIDKVKSIVPDLIIANKEENTREQIEELAKHFPVWVSDIQTVADALYMISEVGAITGEADNAQQIIGDIQSGFDVLKKASTPKCTAYFIWRDPWMCAGGDTFINDMIVRMGWVNVLNEKMRYPEIQLEELIPLKPEIILLSSEPYPFKDKHIEEIKTVLPNTNVLLVDGEMFSWYGSRLLHATSYMDALAYKYKDS